MVHEKVLAVKNQINLVTAEVLGLPSSTEINPMAIYRNLTRRLQELLFAASKPLQLQVVLGEEFSNLPTQDKHKCSDLPGING